MKTFLMYSKSGVAFLNYALISINYIFKYSSLWKSVINHHRLCGYDTSQTIEFCIYVSQYCNVIIIWPCELKNTLYNSKKVWLSQIRTLCQLCSRSRSTLNYWVVYTKFDLVLEWYWHQLTTIITFSLLCCLLGRTHRQYQQETLFHHLHLLRNVIWPVSIVYVFFLLPTGNREFLCNVTNNKVFIRYYLFILSLHLRGYTVFPTESGLNIPLRWGSNHEPFRWNCLCSNTLSDHRVLDTWIKKKHTDD